LSGSVCKVVVGPLREQAPEIESPVEVLGAGFQPHFPDVGLVGNQLDGDFGLYDDPGLPQLEHTLQRFPNLIILGHGPVFWAEIGKLETPGERGYVFKLGGGQVGRVPEGPIKEEGVVPKLLRRYPNLHLDLSDGTAYNAIARDEDYGPAFLEEFQDRAYFGTDFCYQGMKIHLPELLLRWRDQGRISNTAFEKIARGNAIRLLGLEETI